MTSERKNSPSTHGLLRFESYSACTAKPRATGPATGVIGEYRRRDSWIAPVLVFCTVYGLQPKAASGSVQLYPFVSLA